MERPGTEWVFVIVVPPLCGHDNKWCAKRMQLVASGDEASSARIRGLWQYKHIRAAPGHGDVLC
jgi:hypothetical protein